MKSENNKLKFNFRIVKHNFLQLDVSLALCSGSGLPPPFSPTDPSFPAYPVPICCPRPCQKVVNICSLHATCFAFLCPFALSSLLSLASAAAFPSYCCCCSCCCFCAVTFHSSCELFFCRLLPVLKFMAPSSPAPPPSTSYELCAFHFYSAHSSWLLLLLMLLQERRATLSVKLFYVHV